MTRTGLLAYLLVALARDAALHGATAQEGDLVVEMTNFRGDPDGIGWLDCHGQAPWNEDGSGPTREVWDVVPLNPEAISPHGFQRWENAMFRPLPARVAEALRPKTEGEG